MDLADSLLSVSAEALKDARVPIRIGLPCMSAVPDSYRALLTKLTSSSDEVEGDGGIKNDFLCCP
jgi:hypothetical protein